MKISVFVLSATAATEVETTTINTSILTVLTKVSHRATRSTADLFKEQLAELVAGDERSSSLAGDHKIFELVQYAKIMAADAMAMKTATSFNEWKSLFGPFYKNIEISKMLQYGCWGQYHPNLPGQFFLLTNKLYKIIFKFTAYQWMPMIERQRSGTVVEPAPKLIKTVHVLFRKGTRTIITCSTSTILITRSMWNFPISMIFLAHHPIMSLMRAVNE